MIAIKFNSACHGCSYRKSYLEEPGLQTWEGRKIISTIIGCIHEDVCEKYKEQSQAMAETKELFRPWRESND